MNIEQFVYDNVIINVSTFVARAILNPGAFDVYQEDLSPPCYDEDEYQEVFQHLVVSEHLAEELTAHGEHIIQDILGIGPIWARTTCGQMICMDSVIEDIWESVRNK